MKLIHQFLNRASNLNTYFLELFTDKSWNFVMNYKIFFEEGEVDFRNLVWKALGQNNNQNIAQYIFNDDKFH